MDEKTGKRVSLVDQDVANKRRSTIFTSGQYANRRKSSIPFALHAPVVRFSRDETEYSAVDDGPHAPITGGSAMESEFLGKSKPILKHDNRPILVDETKLDRSLDSMAASLDLEENEHEVEFSTAKIQFVVTVMFKAERHARGAIDLLTFPTATGHIDALSRIQGSLVGTGFTLFKTFSRRRQNIDRHGQKKSSEIQ